MELVRNHWQEDQQISCLQNSRKVKAIKERLWNTSLPYRQITSLAWMRSTAWSEKSTQDQQTILWNIWMWIYGYMENTHECHSQSSNSSRKWPWREFEKLARDVERYVRSSAKQRKTRVCCRKTEAWQRLKIARYLLHWSSGCGVQRTIKSARRKLEVPDASSKTLQDQEKKVQGNLSHSWCSQDKTRMHRWSRRVNENAFGRNSTLRSWRSHRRETNQLIEPLQSRAQVCSHA